MRKILTPSYILIWVLFMVIHSSYAKKYNGAEVRTNESFLYGKFEVKMKSSHTSGMLISFFTFYDSPDFAQNWNEIDIEILGRYNNEVQFNSIVGNHEMHEHRQKLDFNPHEAYHVYSFEWTPEYISWSVDGKEVYKQTGAHISAMNKAQKIMMNIWPSSFYSWTGPWENPKLPLFASYDYVKYYSYTPKKKDTFTLSWVDNFDFFDKGRWSTASHTFDGNLCTFTPENVEVKEGYLYLKLDHNPNELPKSEETAKVNAPTEHHIVSATIESLSLIKVTFNKDTYQSGASKKNYKIEGVTIAKTKLHKDLRTLDIIIDGLQEGKEYTLVFTPPGGKPQEIPLIWNNK